MSSTSPAAARVTCSGLQTESARRTQPPVAHNRRSQRRCDAEPSRDARLAATGDAGSTRATSGTHALPFRRVESVVPTPNEPDGTPADARSIPRQLARLCRDGEANRVALAGLVYDDLRAAAANLLRRERDALTLQPTALVHEAWLRLLHETSLDESQQTTARRTYLSHAVQAMRRILIEHARARLRSKRGGNRRPEELPAELPAALAAAIGDAPEMLDLDEGLNRLAERRPRVAKIAELRIFAGLSTAEAGEVVGVSLATAKVEWALAQALLSQHVRSGLPRE